MGDRVEFPNWLPRLVRERAHELHAIALATNSAEDVAEVMRITTDARMKNVWRYLESKRRIRSRRSAHYQHPAIDPMRHESYARDGFSTRAEWMQQIGMRAIYEMMFRLARPGLMRRWTEMHTYNQCSMEEFSLEEIWNQPNPFRDQAATLRANATKWSEQLNENNNGFAELQKAIALMLRAADSLDAAYRARFRTTPREVLTAVTALIARQMASFFGTPMYGQTAIIASVVLDRSVTIDQAREAHRGVWGAAHKVGA
jgi:hypothetical protein